MLPTARSYVRALTGPQTLGLLFTFILLLFLGHHSFSNTPPDVTPTPPTTPADKIPKPNTDGKYTLSSPGGVRAQFVPFGAAISNLFIMDKHGRSTDIVLGYDNASFYADTQWHDHMGGIPGRYANRIRDATVLIDGAKYKLNANEHGNMLHGGADGWDQREWNVVQYKPPGEIVFGLKDADGTMGFPGDVDATVKYTLDKHGAWGVEIRAVSLTKKTPIMLTSHVYWNLDGLTSSAYHHDLYLPFSGLRVGVDGALIPTGSLLPNTNGSVNDFWSAPKKIGERLELPEAKDNCGKGCTGYDNCFVVGPHDGEKEPIAVLRSHESGVRVRVFSDQGAMQVYSCEGQDGTRIAKKTQKGRAIKKGDCVVLEVQDWIDAVNHPEWGRWSLYTPKEEFVLKARYEFDVI